MNKVNSATEWTSLLFRLPQVVPFSNLSPMITYASLTVHGLSQVLSGKFWYSASI
jgi:hypothetical protein